jgi:hypothetical protein
MQIVYFTKLTGFSEFTNVESNYSVDVIIDLSLTFFVFSQLLVIVREKQKNKSP